MDVQKAPSWNLQSRIANLLQKRSSSDVVFQVGRPSQQFFGHKVILAAGSPVFDAMFFGVVGQSSPVCVPDVTAQGFAILLQYLYTDTATLRDEIEAFDVAYVAKKYMVTSLFALCERFLLKHCRLDPGGVFDTYELASVLEMNRLQNHCLGFMSRRVQAVLRSSSFRKASGDALQDILMRMDLLNIDTDQDIVEALFSFEETRLDDCFVENVREQTRELLRYVQFFDLGEDDILDFAKMCGVICFPGPVKMLRDVSAKPKKRSISNATKVGLPVEYRYDGSMRAFVLENRQCELGLAVKGPPVTIIGVTVAFKIIPCYSRPDRFLEVKIAVVDPSCDHRSVAEGRFDPECFGEDEQQHFLLLDDFVSVEEDQPVTITVTASGEGVRVMQCSGDEVRCTNGDSTIVLTFEKDEASERRVSVVPVKDIVIVR